MDNTSSQQSLRGHVHNIIIGLPVVYVFTGMWWLPEGDKFTPPLILLCALYFLLTRSWHSYDEEVSRNRKPFVLALIATTLICGLGYLMKDGNIAELRTLGALSIYAIITLGIRIDQRVWLFSIATSGVGFISICFYQYFIENQIRASLFYNPVPFANGLAVVLIASMVATFTGKAKATVAIYAILSVFLFASLAMTGTRGVVLPVLLVTIALGVACFSTLIKARPGVAMLLLAFFFVAGGAATNILDKRITHSLKELETLQAGDLNSSAGLRLQFWKAATEMVKLNPLTGSGEGHWELFQKLAAEDVVNRTAALYAPHHYHNQYLDLLVKRGVPGLLAFVALLAAPVISATRQQKKNRTTFYTIWSISFLYAVASLTDVPFNHPITIYMFVMSAICMLVPARQDLTLKGASLTDPSVA